jgi:hypothetical protein
MFTMEEEARKGVKFYLIFSQIFLNINFNNVGDIIYLPLSYFFYLPLIPDNVAVLTLVVTHCLLPLLHYLHPRCHSPHPPLARPHPPLRHLYHPRFQLLTLLH